VEISAIRSGTGILPVVLQLFPNQLDRLEACPTIASVPLDELLAAIK
jgi:hypothetical protein